jgi:hypothetical protein
MTRGRNHTQFFRSFGSGLAVARAQTMKSRAAALSVRFFKVVLI